MVKVIVAENKLDMTHMLGQFPTEKDYDILVEEDCDVYAPPNCDLATQAECNVPTDCSTCETGMDERRIIFKFRKNWFTKEEQDAAYAGLREAAVETQNRGVAAGPRQGSLGNRQWVTEYEYEMLDQFLKPTENLFGEDPIEEVRKKYAGKKDSASNRARVWSIERVKKEKFKFEEWVDEMKQLPSDEAKEKAEYVAEKLICMTTYANSVNSGIAGWFDRYPRIPYGRATSYTRDKFDKFQMSFPFLQSLSRGFKELMPWRYGNQMEAAKKLDQGFLVPGTPFTTITVNKTFRTACHFDAGDLNSGLSNLLTLSNNGNYSGCYLVAPEYRVAVNVRPGDLLLINNHEVMHGNTEIVCHDDVAERISLVCYFREKMLELGSKQYEDTRFQFVEDRRLNKEHKEQRALWNGVSPGMWESEEWYDYLREKMGEAELYNYHPAAQKSSSLEGFF
jgi:hypothetical protein